MYYTINELPNDAKPRERLLKFGAKALSDYELLAIILRTGIKNESVLDVAKNLIIKLRNLGNFNEVTIEELKKVAGIGIAKAIEILAAIEFGKRVCQYKGEKFVLRSNNELYNYIRFDFENLKHEEIRAYYLNIKGGLIDYRILGIGNVNSSTCDEKEIVKWALKLSSSNVIIVHNHPSGDSRPSNNDIIYTKRLVDFCKLMDINLIEHMIIGKDNYYGIISSYFNSK